MLISVLSVVDLFVVGSSVNNLACKDSDADICLIFADRPEKMDQQVVAVQLLNRIKSFLSRDSKWIKVNHSP